MVSTVFKDRFPGDPARGLDGEAIGARAQRRESDGPIPVGRGQSVDDLLGHQISRGGRHGLTGRATPLTSGASYPIRAGFSITRADRTEGLSCSKTLAKAVFLQISKTSQ